MKIDYQENLVSLEMFFHEVLGYDCYWVEHSKWSYSHMVSSALVIELVSINQMIKLMDSFTAKKFQTEKILSGEIPIPQTLDEIFNLSETKPNIMVANIFGSKNAQFCTGTLPPTYDFEISAFAGYKAMPYLYYFLFCFDRDSAEFQSVPFSVVEEIESFLASKARPIFNEM